MVVPSFHELVSSTDDRGYYVFDSKSTWEDFHEFLSSIVIFVAVTHAHPTDGLRSLVVCYDDLADKYNNGLDPHTIAVDLADKIGFEIIDENEAIDENLELYLYELLSTLTYYAFIHGTTADETVQIFDENRYWEMLACRGRFFASLDPIDINDILQSSFNE